MSDFLPVALAVVVSALLLSLMHWFVVRLYAKPIPV
jgi:hypothetical protein